VAAHRIERGNRAFRKTTRALLSLLTVRGKRSDKMGYYTNKMKTNRSMCFVEWQQAYISRSLHDPLDWSFPLSCHFNKNSRGRAYWMYFPVTFSFAVSNILVT
jgi:hypothetical protein